MRRFTSAVAVVVVLSVAASLFAQTAPPWVGTWKSNFARSTYSPGPPSTLKSQIVRAEAVANGIKTTIDTIDAQGKASQTEITAMFDGKEYELKGAANPTTRVYRRIDNRSYEYDQRVNGKVTGTTRVVISADGKTRTNTTDGTNARGQKVHNVAVSERQ
jgi:hypothetical protein